MPSKENFGTIGICSPARDPMLSEQAMQVARDLKERITEWERPHRITENAIFDIAVALDAARAEGERAGREAAAKVCEAAHAHQDDEKRALGVPTQGEVFAAAIREQP